MVEVERFIAPILPPRCQKYSWNHGYAEFWATTYRRAVLSGVPGPVTSGGVSGWDTNELTSIGRNFYNAYSYWLGKIGDALFTRDFFPPPKSPPSPIPQTSISASVACR